MNSDGTSTKRRRTREDRRRTARACDRCRRLKERCQGGIPCSRCIHLRRQCEFRRCSTQTEYTDPPADVSHEKHPEVNIPELLERVTYMETILKHKFEGIGLDLDNLRRVARALEEDGQSNPVVLAVPDDDPIEEENCTIDPVEDTTTHYSGEFSYWNFSMRVKRHIEERMHPQDHVQVSNYWRAEQLHSSVRSIADAISSCPPRHIADFLLGVFFKHAETYYFYVDRAWLMERVAALYNEPETFTRKSAAVISIILMVMAIATQYAYLDAPTSRPSSRRSDFSEDALGSMFYQQAIRLLPEIIEASSLESVQACLLFTVYALPIDASGLGYIYITLTNRLGMQNGMHRKYTGTGLSAAMVETRNRVWWTAYTLERKISIFHGRPLSTHTFDVDAPLPSDSALLDVQHRPTTAYAVAAIHLTQRLEEFRHEMFLLRTCQKRERPTVLSRLVNGKQALESWWKTLPSAVHTTPTDKGLYRAVKHLQLEYCLVRMFIGRPLLLTGALSTSTPNSEDSISDPRDCPLTYREELVECALEAARTALSHCLDLHTGGLGLARASYIEYSSCRAALLVLIAHSIQTQSDQHRGELLQGLEMIREMAASGESARSEVQLLEALERALERLLSNRTGSQHDSGDPGGAGYDGFKQWESAWTNGALVADVD
ncbi:fungal-specific transcription factor domain-containing protein [Aspergillus unguis]